MSSQQSLDAAFAQAAAEMEALQGAHRHEWAAPRRDSEVVQTMLDDVAQAYGITDDAQSDLDAISVRTPTPDAVEPVYENPWRQRGAGTNNAGRTEAPGAPGGIASQSGRAATPQPAPTGNNIVHDDEVVYLHTCVRTAEEIEAARREQAARCEAKRAARRVAPAPRRTTGGLRLPQKRPQVAAKTHRPAGAPQEAGPSTASPAAEESDPEI